MGFDSDADAFRSKITPAERKAMAERADDPRTGLHAYLEAVIPYAEASLNLPPGSLQSSDPVVGNEEFLQGVRNAERQGRAAIEVSIDWRYYETVLELLRVLRAYPPGSRLTATPPVNVMNLAMDMMNKAARHHREAYSASTTNVPPDENSDESTKGS